MLRERSVPLDLDGEDGDVGPFTVLDPIASRARIAFVGEMDHVIQEKYDFRLMCIRYLAGRGWRWFGEEVPASQGSRADEYLQTGKESLLEPVREPPWFTSGILANDRQPAAALDEAQRQFMISVRRVAPEVRWFGYDADATDSEYVAMANGANSYLELRPAMALRQEIVYENVASRLRVHPEERFALLGAAFHLLKDDDEVRAPGVGAGPGSGEVPSLGHFVTHHLAQPPVLSIWLLHGRGRTANPWIPPPGELRPRRDTFDGALAHRYSSPQLVPVSGDSKRRRVTQMHNLILTCRLSEQVDAIVFAPYVRPPTSRPGPLRASPGGASLHSGSRPFTGGRLTAGLRGFAWVGMCALIAPR